MIFAQEKYSACSAEAETLGAAHWREMYQNGDFDPDIEEIKAQEERGEFVYFSMRGDDGVLRGQAAFVLQYAAVFREHIATDSFCYIAPGFRGQHNMTKLIAYAAEYLRNAGIRRVFASHHVAQDLSKPIEAAGFALVSKLYVFQEGDHGRIL